MKIRLRGDFIGNKYIPRNEEGLRPLTLNSREKKKVYQKSIIMVKKVKKMSASYHEK